MPIRTGRHAVTFAVAMVMLAAAFVGVMPLRAAGNRWTLDLESGPAWSGYNDVQIPNPQGTRFSLSRDFSIPARPFFRGRLTWKINSRHALSVLYAPLSLKARGTAAGPISFFGTLFPAGATLAGTYTFNSYRLTWRYTLLEKETFTLAAGFTAKIRDAEIALRGGGLEAAKANVGFVPLLHLLADWRWSKRFGMRLEADALAAPQGRAEDVLLALTWRWSDTLSGRLGYRFVEGGADNEEVYNFAFIHYAAAGISLSF